MKEILFRGRTSRGRWIIGSLLLSKKSTPIIVEINDEVIRKDGHNWCINAPAYEVISGTIGQLRHENKHGKYFDGDIYKCSGCGLDVVSDLCEITDRLMHGDTDDIGEIVGNIHDNPEIRI